MSTSAGRVLSGVRRAAFGSGSFLRGASATGRTLNNVRSLAVTTQMSARSKEPAEDEEKISEPIKFSTSKASHKTWRVDRSMGSQFERPWWKVLPICVALSSFLLWCVLRDETDIDTQLEKQLYEHLPGLLADKEERKDQDKSA